MGQIRTPSPDGGVQAAGSVVEPSADGGVSGAGGVAVARADRSVMARNEIETPGYQSAKGRVGLLLADHQAMRTSAVVTPTDIKLLMHTG